MWTESPFVTGRGKNNDNIAWHAICEAAAPGWVSSVEPLNEAALGQTFASSEWNSEIIAQAVTKSPGLPLDT
jgi:hypothetical protein